MTKRIRAIQAYRPRIRLGPTVQLAELSRYIADQTGLDRAEILMVLMKLQDVIVAYANSGRGVKLEGLGTYLPNIGLDGTMDVQHRLDRQLKRRLNRNRRDFGGTIINEHNIGKTPDELVALWDAAHPEDAVED